MQSGLRLGVNREKSAAAPLRERKFLGRRLLRGGRLGLAPESLTRVKARIWRITRRNRGISLEGMVHELSSFLTRWVTYFRYAECRTQLRSLEEWPCRKLRWVRLKQRRRAKPIADFLQGLGVPECRAWLLAGSGKGWWRLAGSPQAAEAMTPDSIRGWFRDQCLVTLTAKYNQLNQ